MISNDSTDQCIFLAASYKVVKNKNNYPVSVSFNIKVFTADSLIKIDVIRINKLHIWSLNKYILT